MLVWQPIRKARLSPAWGWGRLLRQNPTCPIRRFFTSRPGILKEFDNSYNNVQSQYFRSHIPTLAMARKRFDQEARKRPDVRGVMIAADFLKRYRTTGGNFHTELWARKHSTQQT